MARDDWFWGLELGIFLGPLSKSGGWKRSALVLAMGGLGSLLFMAPILGSLKIILNKRKSTPLPSWVDFGLSKISGPEALSLSLPVHQPTYEEYKETHLKQEENQHALSMFPGAGTGARMTILFLIERAGVNFNNRKKIETKNPPWQSGVPLTSACYTGSPGSRKGASLLSHGGSTPEKPRHSRCPSAHNWGKEKSQRWSSLMAQKGGGGPTWRYGRFRRRGSSCWARRHGG